MTQELSIPATRKGGGQVHPEVLRLVGPPRATPLASAYRERPSHEKDFVKSAAVASQ